MLKGKKIILGVCGGIAAYKSALITRLLIKSGAEVKVIMTNSAKAFITPLTLGTLSKNSVHSALYNSETGEWINHVSLGMWADAILIAPLTANTLQKLATGACDNLLTSVYLSSRCPVVLAPAMDLDMYVHPSVKRNMETLENDGCKIIQATDGELASGLSGVGRMAEPEDICKYLESLLHESAPLKGKRVLISAGPTYEAIDPVRFVGNHSSGKMGIALAENALLMGAEVTLVCGPTTLNSNQKIHRINVTSAEEMANSIFNFQQQAEIIIMAAAVADYRPKMVASQKIKKSTESLTIELVKTTDILLQLGKSKSKNQLLVGFALETENELENAKLKLKSKNLDLIVLNSMQTKGAGFGTDTNYVTLVDKNFKTEHSGLHSKDKIATFILEKIHQLL